MNIQELVNVLKPLAGKQLAITYHGNGSMDVRYINCVDVIELAPEQRVGEGDVLLWNGTHLAGIACGYTLNSSRVERVERYGSGAGWAIFADGKLRAEIDVFVPAV